MDKTSKNTGDRSLTCPVLLTDAQSYLVAADWHEENNMTKKAAELRSAYTSILGRDYVHKKAWQEVQRILLSSEDTYYRFGQRVRRYYLPWNQRNVRHTIIGRNTGTRQLLLIPSYASRQSTYGANDPNPIWLDYSDVRRVRRRFSYHPDNMTMAQRVNKEKCKAFKIGELVEYKYNAVHRRECVEDPKSGDMVVIAVHTTPAGIARAIVTGETSRHTGGKFGVVILPMNDAGEFKPLVGASPNKLKKITL